MSWSLPVVGLWVVILAVLVLVAACAPNLSANVDRYCAITTAEEREAMRIALGLPADTEAVCLTYPMPE